MSAAMFLAVSSLSRVVLHLLPTQGAAELDQLNHVTAELANHKGIIEWDEDDSLSLEVFINRSSIKPLLRMKFIMHLWILMTIKTIS